MYCPYCGTQLPDEATFCSACGNRIAQAQPEPGLVQQQAAATPKKRSAVFGVITLILALLYPVTDLLWRIALYHMITGDSRFIPRMFFGVYSYNLILAFIDIVSMILIAIYYLAQYPKKKSTVLAAIGAILMIITRIVLSLNSTTIPIMITIVGLTLLAVYWFSKEKISILGIIGAICCIAATCITQLRDLFVNGVAFGSPLFWAALAMDLVFALFWTIVLIAIIVGRTKKA